jgi:transcriptional regulator with XRE-family HTH domain
MQNEDFRKAFGGRLKELRKQKRWSQKEMAAKVDIRFEQLNKHESGLNIPPAEMLVKLTDALGTTADFLLTGNPVEKTPLCNTRLFQCFQAVERFEPGDQEAVIILIDAMIAKHQMETALEPVDQQAANGKG